MSFAANLSGDPPDSCGRMVDAHGCKKEKQICRCSNKTRWQAFPAKGTTGAAEISSSKAKAGAGDHAGTERRKIKRALRHHGEVPHAGGTCTKPSTFRAQGAP